MTLEDLRVLIAVAQHRNMTTAARSLGCTQAAVGQHVRRLEAELGTALVLPGRRGSTLTPAGERFTQAATEALSALARGARVVKELADPDSGSLRIATGGTTVTHFMGDAVAAFRTEHPTTNVELHSAGSTRRCVAALHQDLADLAFVTMSDALTDIDVRPTIETGWTLVRALDIGTDRRRRIALADLPDGNYISLHPSSTAGQELNRQLRQAGVKLPSETTVDNWDTAVKLVELQLGNAIVPDLHATNLESAHRVAQTAITDLAPLRFGWATPDHRLLPGAANAFVKLFPTTLTTTTRTRLLKSDWQRN